MAGKNMTKSPKTKLQWEIILYAGAIMLAVTEFVLHRMIPFMMDDLWYSTNLVTGERLRNLADIVESQKWHFLNWGGRCITHGVLQLTLMCPEWVADLCNLAMTLLLGKLICLLAGQKGPMWFLMASSMLISLNANWKMSMFWQSGTVNYVYSSVWILVFWYVYLSKLKDTDHQSLPLIHVWIVPLGVMAGWSNENVGPVCFLLAAFTAFHLFLKKQKIPVWVMEGAVSSLAGSVLVIAAPGNFVRSALIPRGNLGETLWERFLSMLTAGADFLFPSALLLTLTLLIRLAVANGKLSIAQWVLLAGIVLSFGAMVLSPHYPDRATFGTMVLCIVLLQSIWKDLLTSNEKLMPYAAALTLLSWVNAMLIMMEGCWQNV